LGRDHGPHAVAVRAIGVENIEKELDKLINFAQNETGLFNHNEIAHGLNEMMDAFFS
jgi:hypothetical protein